MEKNFIPNFKKSGESLYKDLLRLKKLEAISDGWYKGKLASYLEKVAGKIIVDGIECYNTDIRIGSYTSKSDNSQYAKDLKGLLKLLGLNDNALESIYNTSLNSQVNGIFLNFDKNVDLNREYTEFDFKQAIKELIELLSNASKFELTQDNKTYSTYQEIRPAVASSNIYTSSAWVIDNDYFGELQEYSLTEELVEESIDITRDFSINQAMHFSKLRILNSLNEDITNNYPIQLVSALKCLLVISGDSFVQLDSLTKISEEIYYNTFLEENVYVVKSKEVYNNIKINSFEDTQFDRYKNGTLKTRIDLEDTYKINGILANNFWTFYLVIDSLDNDLTNDLFYISKRKWTFLGKIYYDESSAKRYITVNGLKKTNAKIIASYLSQYSDFQISQKKKKRTFLGIGGFLGNMLGGFFELILQGIGFIAEILYYIPMVRVQIQAIAWIFSGKWSNDKDRFKQVATRLIIAAIAAVITFLTAGAGWQLAVSLMASAYNLYSGIKEYDNLVETAKQKQKDNDSISDDELYDKVLDFSNNENINATKNEIMYKPYTEINSIYKNTFDKGGMYDIKYGL